MKPVTKCALIFLTAGIFLISACKKLPPFGDLSSDFVVYTKYDAKANFSSYKTFSIRDTIEVITGDPRDTIWYDNDAQNIIAEVVKQMENAGYTQAPTHLQADLAVQLVGIRNTSVYYVPPGWWWGYPGWVPPCYWGYCGGGGYYYPYYYSFSVSTGTFLIELADLKNAVENGVLNIVWTGVGNGQVGTSTSFVVSQCLLTADQSFAQSPYLKAQ
jgi:Domain of unknown function (DUF4136)